MGERSADLIGTSEREVLRNRSRTSAVTTAQVRDQGRHIRGHPPYGYQLVRRIRAALEAGADLVVVTGWISEVQKERGQVLEVLNMPRPQPVARDEPGTDRGSRRPAR
ncbi:hypothetical protein Acy02nite_61010 [Actinoplanes cyaneus]|uniref:Uncharacterized protein n=1 Tax=Actinoplanes cyaneus TaxID=52696 RepID=A0A919ILG4_9ACTN|nr:hypothetical protein [Actinoplanes cyaneus]GID68220.1 hypothetical protein Acy02nite_61010 [Actinoplanes cyaneus]